MKTVIAAIMGLFLTGQVQAYENVGLTCEAHGPHFRLNVAPQPAYVILDHLFITALAKDIAPLLEAGDENLQITESSLRMSVPERSCSINTGAGPRLASCSVDASVQTSQWRELTLNFTHIRKTPGGQHEVAKVSRMYVLEKLKLTASVVAKPDFRGVLVDRVIAQVEIQAKVGSDLRTIKFTKDLGEWTDKANRSNWDRCVITRDKL